MTTLSPEVIEIIVCLAPAICLLPAIFGIHKKPVNQQPAGQDSDK